jgi:hypothetical protein
MAAQGKIAQEAEGPGNEFGLAAGSGSGERRAQMKARGVDGNALAIGGTFDKPGGGTGVHWLLATSFTIDSGGSLSQLVADDPWTGLQVRIDPATKTVVSPPGFPLANFTVDRFRVIRLK